MHWIPEADQLQLKRVSSLFEHNVRLFWLQKHAFSCQAGSSRHRHQLEKSFGDDNLIHLLKNQYLKNVRLVNLSDCFNLTARSLSQIGMHSLRIQHLNISRTGVDNQSLVEIVSELKELEVLILDDCKGVNGTGLLTALVKCKELRQLSMAGLNLRDCPNWLESLPETIKKLDLRRCKLIVSVTSKLANVKELNAQYSELSDDDINAICRSCTNLEVFTMPYLSWLSDESVVF